MITLSNEIKNKIDNAQIVSFDIFDTLLLRPYVKPVDLFLHIEKIFGIANFKNIRIEAEKQARKNNSQNEDINIHQIYDCMPSKLANLKNEEINFEKKILTVNKNLKKIYDYAIQTGKKVVIASDMYLPNDIMSDILKQKGYTSYEKLYVSGECLQAKYTGSMYDLILNDFNVAPNKILHFGDNIHSDYKVPKAKKIEAVLVKKALDKLIEINPRTNIFLEKTKEDLAASILIGLNSILVANEIDFKDNYWQYFGSVYGGAVCYSFMKYALDIAVDNNIDKLLFVARDGYVLNKVFNEIKTKDIKTEYVYAPRNLALKCTLDIDRRMSANDFENRTITNHLIKIYLEKHPDKKEEVEQKENFSEKKNYILTKIEELKTIAQSELKAYQKYLSNYVTTNEKVAMVDTITGYFTAQKLLETALNCKLHSIYWIADLIYFKNAKEHYNFNSFVENNEMNVRDWKIMEFIMTSPEGPIENIIDGKPVYKTTFSIQEQRRMEIFPNIENGVLEFVKLKQEIFENIDIYFTNDIITKWINLFCTMPTEYEVEKFSKLGFACDCNHDEYIAFPTPWFRELPKDYKVKPLQHVFSIKNEGNKKVLRLLGFKIKLKRKIKF